jgi:acyl-CoA dehydrogenase
MIGAKARGANAERRGGGRVMEKQVGVSEQEREMLRESVRRFLADRWPAEGAVERAMDGEAVRQIWRDCAAQGLTTLGADPAEAGAREILLVFEELGRAACPAPLVGGVAANLLFAGAKTTGPAAEVLGQLHQGAASLAVALGGFDGDLAAGRVEYANGSLNGRTQFVEGAGTATHFVVLIDDPSGVAIVPAGAPGLSVTATPGLAVPALSELTFASRPTAFVERPAGLLADVALTIRLACAARAMGAAQRAFDLAVEHAKLRKQFGQLIGTFQAIQHKLADCLIRLDGSHLVIEGAAAAHDRGDESWRVFASTGLAFACPALRQTILEAHHAIGAIGYAEEHEVPRHFRRVHADLVRFGGAPRARAELADYLLGPVGSA